MLKFIESTFSHDLSIEDYRTIFGIVNINRAVSVPNRNDIASLIREITGAIKNGDEKKKKVGLSWLYEMVKWCSVEVLGHYSQTWMKITIEMLANSSGIYKEEAFRIIRVLLNRLPLSQIDKHQEQISSVIQHIVQTNACEKFIGNLECLETILEKAPNACKTKIDVIEHFLVARFGAFNEGGVEVVASCMSQIPSLYGDQSRNVWCHQLEKIINTLTKIMDIFYKIISVEVDTEISECYELPDVCGSFFPFVLYLRYFHTLSVCAVKMFSGNYLHTIFPAKKSITLIDLVFSYCQKYDKFNQLSAQKMSWLTILPCMVKSTLELLESLIVNCWEVLHGYATSILSLIVTKLETFLSFESKHMALRCNFYRIITALFSKVKDTSMGNYYPQIMKFFIEDIQPLSTNNRTFMEGRPDMLNPTLVPDTFQIEFKRKSCHEALKALSVLVNTRNIRDIEGLYKEILKIFNHLSFTTIYPVPYDDADSCRLELYHLLLAGINDLPSLECKSFALTFQVFQRGMNDNNIQISNFCRMALRLSNCMPLIKSQVTEEEKVTCYDTNFPSTQPLSIVHQKDFFGEFEPEIIPKEIIESFMSESNDGITNNISSSSANQDLLEPENEDAHMLLNHNEEDLDDEEILENEESMEDDQMENESEEEEGEIDDEEDEEDDDEECDEEYDEEQKVIFDVESPAPSSPVAENCESQENEKRPVDNGYFTMQNGTISSDETVTPIVDKDKQNLKSKEHEEELPPAKKLKITDEHSQDGSLSSGSVNMYSMLSDFVDKPPDDNEHS